MMLRLAALVTAALGATAIADPAPAAPDFSGHVPRPGPDMKAGGPAPTAGVDRRLAASTGTQLIAPFDDLVFARSSTALDADAIATVDDAARWLRAHPRYRIVLEGHANVPDSPEYAEDLANRRADMVRSHLMARGIGSDRIIVLTGADPGRDLVMFASDQPVAQIVTGSLDYRHVRVAAWTDHGTLFQEHNGLGEEPRHETVATRH